MSETNFERYCRLCAEEQEVTVMLFSKEAADMLLLEKLWKYLRIKVGLYNKRKVGNVVFTLH